MLPAVVDDMLLTFEYVQFNLVHRRCRSACIPQSIQLLYAKI